MSDCLVEAYDIVKTEDLCKSIKMDEHGKN
jgi:hypothetical protein